MIFNIKKKYENVNLTVWCTCINLNIDKYANEIFFIVSVFNVLWVMILNWTVEKSKIIMEENEVYNVTASSFFESAFWNYSDHVILDDLKMDSNFIWLLCSLVSGISWIVYIAYYNSRVVGYIITKLLNRFVIRDGYVKVGKLRISELSVSKRILNDIYWFYCCALFAGSLTLSALSGKIMFRDIVYITTDYSFRIQDGWLIFRWWRSYVPKDVSEGKYL